MGVVRPSVAFSFSYETVHKSLHVWISYENITFRNHTDLVVVYSATLAIPDLGEEGQVGILAPAAAGVRMLPGLRKI